MLEPPDEAPASLEPVAQVFTANYDQAWRAAQKALAAYPLQLNNIDQGLLETDILKPEQVWVSPFPRARNQTIGRYRLRLKLTKGRTGGRESVRVSVHKQISLEKDFFSGEASLPSDGYEEKSLIYRIARELQIEKSLKRHFETPAE